MIACLPIRIVAFAATLGQQQHSRADDKPAPFFADNAFGNPLSVVTHPGGEFFDGVTYMAYQGPHEDPYVCSYVHATGEWTGPIRAGTNVMGYYPDPTFKKMTDNHGRPTMTISADGYIHLFYGGHGGDPSLGGNLYGNEGKGKHSHVVSHSPRDITRWDDVSNTSHVDPFGSYASSATMDNGDMYVFVRHGGHQSDWTYQRSTNGGRGFAPSVPFLKSKPTQKRECTKPGPPCPDKNAAVSSDSWYAFLAKGQRGSAKSHVIACCFVYHLHEAPNHGHYHYNGYYMELNTQTGKWSNVLGEELEMPLTKEDADKYALVFDSKDTLTEFNVCSLDHNGDPHIIFDEQGTDINKAHETKRKRYWRWASSQQKWLSSAYDPWTAKVRFGNFVWAAPTPNPADRHPVRLLMLMVESEGGGTTAVRYRESMDDGLTWTKGPAVFTTKGKVKHISPLFRNPHPDAQFMLTTIPSTSDDGSLYARVYLIGDHGAVQRSYSEATGHTLQIFNYTAHPEAMAATHFHKKGASHYDLVRKHFAKMMFGVNKNHMKNLTAGQQAALQDAVKVRTKLESQHPGVKLPWKLDGNYTKVMQKHHFTI